MKKTTFIATALLLCSMALLWAQTNAPTSTPAKADAPSAIPTREFVSSFVRQLPNPKKSSERIFFNVSVRFQKLSENERQKYNKAEKGPYELYVNFYNQAPVASSRAGGAGTAVPRYQNTPLNGTVNFVLVDSQTNVVKKTSSSIANFRPYRDIVPFGDYKAYVWLSYGTNTVFGATTNFSVYVPPAVPTMPTPPKK